MTASVSRRSHFSFFSHLAVAVVMAERLTFLVTCFVVLSKSAFVVPGLYQSGSQLIDDWNFFPREPGCVPLHRRYGSLCSNFSYNTTRPSGAAGFNFLHHSSQAEAFGQLQSFSRLVNSSCSRDLQFLLCSYHFPICNDNLLEPITPCRSLCERVQRECSPTLQRAGKRWPETINCSHLLPESRLEGGERMHVCVLTTNELDQATRATPIANPNRTQTSSLPPTQPAAVTVATEPATEPTVRCPTCKSQKIKKKIIKKGKFNWFFLGTVAGEAVVKGKRVCHAVNTTTIYYSHCANVQHPQPGTTVSVCVLRASPTCALCPRAAAKEFTIGKQTFFAGTMIKSGRYIIDLDTYPLFVPHKTSLLGKVPKWIRKFYKKRCPK